MESLKKGSKGVEKRREKRQVSYIQLLNQFCRPRDRYLLLRVPGRKEEKERKRRRKEGKGWTKIDIVEISVKVCSLISGQKEKKTEIASPHSTGGKVSEKVWNNEGWNGILIEMKWGTAPLVPVYTRKGKCVLNEAWRVAFYCVRNVYLPGNYLTNPWEQQVTLTFNRKLYEENVL